MCQYLQARYKIVNMLPSPPKLNFAKAYRYIDIASKILLIIFLDTHDTFLMRKITHKYIQRTGIVMKVYGYNLTFRLKRCFLRPGKTSTDESQNDIHRKLEHMALNT